MTIVAGETSVSIKLDSVELRNKLARLFIAFMMVYKGILPTSKSALRDGAAASK